MPAGRKPQGTPLPYTMSDTIIIDPVDLTDTGNFIRVLSDLTSGVGARIVFVAATDKVVGEGENQTTRKVIEIKLNRQQRVYGTVAIRR